MSYIPAQAMQRHSSCIVSKFTSLVHLSEFEKGLLAELENNAVEVDGGDLILGAEQESPPLYIVKKGWLITEFTDPEGHRSLVRTHHPGDIIGFSDLPFRTTSYRTYAVSNSVICPFTRANLNVLFTTSPRLSSIFLTISLIEQSLQDDRARLSGTNYAAGRVALFILQTINRLSFIPNHSADRFYCPMTQTDIGDLLGLTNVHVSRTFKKLEDAAFITRKQSFIQILNKKELETLAQYTDRLKGYDFSWLPDASPASQLRN
jgi:CRP-like cAMP-binding protein